MDLDNFLQSIMLAFLVSLSHIKPIGNMIDLNNKPQHIDGDTDGVEKRLALRRRFHCVVCFHQYAASKITTTLIIYHFHTRWV